MYVKTFYFDACYWTTFTCMSCEIHNLVLVFELMCCGSKNLGLSKSHNFSVIWDRLLSRHFLRMIWRRKINWEGNKDILKWWFPHSTIKSCLSWYRYSCGFFIIIKALLLFFMPVLKYQHGISLQFLLKSYFWEIPIVTRCRHLY